MFPRMKSQIWNATLCPSSVSDESSYGNAPPPPYHYAAAMKYPTSVVSRSELHMAVEQLQQRMQRVQKKGAAGAEPRQSK